MRSYETPADTMGSHEKPGGAADNASGGARVRPSYWQPTEAQATLTAHKTANLIESFIKELEQPQHCIVCGYCKKAVKQMKRCSGCQATQYCSVACQKADWPSHREICQFHSFLQRKKEIQGAA